LDGSFDLLTLFRRLRPGLDIHHDRWPEVSRIFSAAVDLDRTARGAYLDRACRHDPALRAAVDSLLGAHDEVGSFGEASLFPSPGAANRLAPGSQLGAFRIETLLGAGGMGEVYRAHDTKLGRAVAIKVLPDFVANDADRRSRFEEEARALAALNHPNIGAIYGVEESGDVAALVLELVDGLTLSERLAAGPLSFDEIVGIARQLADGLEAAHDRGIVHRDLKPANIKITAEGNVKILDFGLAKAAAMPVRAAAVDSPDSRHATGAGVIVGTAAYMSPEQARGQSVDKRTDIWAFGCLLFEMCALQPPFAGATVSDTLADVIEREPDWALLRAATPPTVVRVLRRCLTKDPKLRLRDIGEARIALAFGQGIDAEPPARPAKRRIAITTAVATFVLGLASWAGVTLFRPETPGATPVLFPEPPPETTVFHLQPGQTFFALSPDGLRLAFIASSDSRAVAGSRDRRIWIRALKELDARPLEGTEGASSLIWSPDGRSLAFLAVDKLKRIDLPVDRPPGAVVTICEVKSAGIAHGTWGSGDIILLGRGNGGDVIESVPASGHGELRKVLAADPANREARVHWPWFLPDGKRFLYTARRDDGEGELRLGQLDGTSRRIMRVSSNAQWVEPDIVVFARERVLMGQRLNLDAAQPVGQPFPIAEQVEYHGTTSRAMFSTSLTGTVAYHQGANLMQLVWVDGNGKEVGTIGRPAEYFPNSARLSHDDTSLMTTRRQPGSSTYHIYRRDLARGVEEPLTNGRGSEFAAVWTDGGRGIVFSADNGGFVPNLFHKNLATGVTEQLLPPGPQQHPADVFPADGSVAFLETLPGPGFQMFRLPMNPRGAPTPLLQSVRSAANLRLSPDGRAMAYVATGDQSDIYVAPVDSTKRPELVAQGALGGPRWSRDGRQLYFVGRDNVMMSVPLRTAPRLDVGTPRPLFKVKRETWLMDVSLDGRLLLLEPQVRAAERPIVVATDAIKFTRR
jgi:Tol biopolymer transport system component